MEKEKRKKILKSAITITAVAVIALSTLSAKQYIKNNLENNSTNHQITQISQVLDCDMSYMETTKNGNYKFLPHNDTEPIYITFDKNCSQEAIESAKKSLDYMFGILQNINTKYQYKIVDDVSSNFFSDKTVIEYKAENLNGNVTDFKNIQSLANLSIFNQNSNKYQISFDPSSFQDLSEQQQYNSMLRELCHVFQFSKDAETLNADSFVNPIVGDVLGKLTLNDIACLSSVYAPVLTSTQAKLDYYQKAEETIESYNVIDYDTFLNKVENYVPIIYSKFKIVIGQTVQYEEGLTGSAYYAIEIDHNTYKLATFDHKQKRIEQISGKVEKINGVAILKNVKLKHGFGESFVKDQKLTTNICVYALDDENFTIYEPSNSEASYFLAVGPNEIDHGFTLSPTPEHVYDEITR